MPMLLRVISKHKVKVLISFVSAIQMRLRNYFYFFLFLNQNKCCGHGKIIHIHLVQCIHEVHDTLMVFLIFFYNIMVYSKTCVKRPRKKIDKTKIFTTIGSLMEVKSNAECSPWSILQYF